MRAEKQRGLSQFAMGDIAVSVHKMDLFYGSFQALKNINMEFPQKKLTALIGPSGCGKSTLLKSLNRMNDLVDGCKITGEIKIGDTDIYQRGVDLARLRKNVGMVFQRPNPLAMSVYDNIAYGPRTFGIKKRADLDAIVEKSLRGAAMWDEVKDRLNKSALGLSGGQQQRLCIARALAVEPQVLLMDEPTSRSTPSRRARSRSCARSSRTRSPSSWSRTICSRRSVSPIIPHTSSSVRWWRWGRPPRSSRIPTTSARRITSTADSVDMAARARITSFFRSVRGTSLKSPTLHPFPKARQKELPGLIP